MPRDDQALLSSRSRPFDLHIDASPMDFFVGKSTGNNDLSTKGEINKAFLQNVP